MKFPTVTSTEKVSTLGSDRLPSKENSAAVKTIGPSATVSGIWTKCVMLVTMFESSIDESTLSTGSPQAGRQPLEKSLPGPRYLEFKSVPRDELAIWSLAARPKDIATSWTDWMYSWVRMVTRKLEPGAMVLGTAMP